MENNNPNHVPIHSVLSLALIELAQCEKKCERQMIRDQNRNCVVDCLSNRADEINLFVNKIEPSMFQRFRNVIGF